MTNYNKTDNRKDDKKTKKTQTPPRNKVADPSDNLGMVKSSNANLDDIANDQIVASIKSFVLDETTKSKIEQIGRSTIDRILQDSNMQYLKSCKKNEKKQLKIVREEKNKTRQELMFLRRNKKQWLKDLRPQAEDGNLADVKGKRKASREQLFQEFYGKDVDISKGALERFTATAERLKLEHPDRKSVV